jgi:CO/xanthine dehydrogenase Mo-binding subunit
MRWRGISVLTNTPPRGAQRGPGENQIAAAIEPLVDKAARELGIDRVEIRRINAPDMSAKYGAEQGPVTSAYLKDALTKGALRLVMTPGSPVRVPSLPSPRDRRWCVPAKPSAARADEPVNALDAEEDMPHARQAGAA